MLPSEYVTPASAAYVIRFPDHPKAVIQRRADHALCLSSLERDFSVGFVTVIVISQAGLADKLRPTILPVADSGGRHTVWYLTSDSPGYPHQSARTDPVVSGFYSARRCTRVPYSLRVLYSSGNIDWDPGKDLGLRV